MKNMYVLLKVSLILGVLVVGACQRSTAVSTGSKDSLVVINASQPWSLDPALARDTPSVIIMRQVYETLFNQNLQTMEIVPSLAERWAFENDAQGNPTLLRLHLKRGVTFHSGDAFTAADVKFSLDRASVSPHLKNMVEAIDRTEVINDYEALVVLKFPFAPLLNNLAMPLMSITSEKAVTAGGDSYAQNPIGTGAMKFVTWVAGNRIELTRFDDYHGQAPRIKDITFRFIADPATALLEMETGGADLLLNVQPQDITRIESAPNLQLLRAQDFSLEFVGFNVRKPPLDNPKVRQAINHAIDREAIVRTVFPGAGVPGRGPLSRRVWASAADILPQYEYDVEKAKRLLAEAGYPNGFNVKIITNDGATRIDTVSIVLNMLSQVGITAELQILEWAANLEAANRGDHDLTVRSWITVTGDPDYGLEVFHSRAWGAPGNRTFYSNPEVDRLLDAGRMEIDLARREQLYIEAQKIIHEEAPWVYILEGEGRVAARSNLRGFTIDPTGYHTVWNVWFE